MIGLSICGILFILLGFISFMNGMVIKPETSMHQIFIVQNYLVAAILIVGGIIFLALVPIHNRLEEIKKFLISQVEEKK
jgi:hypothetical protein